LARALSLKLDVTSSAVIGFLKGDLDRVLYVLTAPWPARASSSTKAAKKVTEDIAKVSRLGAEVSEIVNGIAALLGEVTEGTALPSRLSKLIAILPVLTELVIFLALLRIGKDLIGSIHLLEPGLGRLITGVNIRVMLAGQLSIGLLYLLLSSLSADTEKLIVILSRHFSPTLF
jgi:hypothetical protein